MKMLSKIDWDKVERTIGSAKFAVFVICLFSVAMIAGTFIESFYGTDFANRVIYKSYTFILIQAGMLLSIIFATILRLPAKKRLYGFYIIHAGLIIIGIGAMITYVAGVDGSITLQPLEPNRTVVLSKDILKITYPEEGKVATTFLPYNAFKTQINEKYRDILIKDYYPFAEDSFEWSNPDNLYPENNAYQSSKYFFKNKFATQDFILTNHPEASVDFQTGGQLGPLTFTYYPKHLANCFAKNNPSKIIIWNKVTGECFTPEEKNYPIKEVAGKRVVIMPYNNDFLTFFPDHTSYPVKRDLGPDESSIIKIFSKSFFEQSTEPNLILFGKKAAYFLKEEKTWKVVDLDKPITLPWMNAEFSLVEHHDKLVPVNKPVPVIPLQKDGSLIKGGLRAVSFELYGKTYWTSNVNPLNLNVNGKNITFEVTQETITLPFELALTQFKMDKNPGTNTPASYESFVKLYADGQSTNHHVYMNNPMKQAGFTFYQASYFEEEGVYSSTLSVNVDQGRGLKYLGSLMLVLGSMLHFHLNNRSKKKSSNTEV